MARVAHAYGYGPWGCEGYLDACLSAKVSVGELGFGTLVAVKQSNHPWVGLIIRSAGGVVCPLLRNCMTTFCSWSIGRLV